MLQLVAHARHSRLSRYLQRSVRMSSESARRSRIRLAAIRMHGAQPSCTARMSLAAAHPQRSRVAMPQLRSRNASPASAASQRSLHADTDGQEHERSPTQPQRSSHALAAAQLERSLMRVVR
ncbi:hypothetical protein WMY93_034140 [Mugilogobius chulae]|uniref:Uncharacterized protein n=1 Tax=Mugilogobius chulae TaxID=88201 RepID=A0AAW0MGW0_9GOBI